MNSFRIAFLQKNYKGLLNQSRAHRYAYLRKQRFSRSTTPNWSWISVLDVGLNLRKILSQMFYKIALLNNFAKVTRKHLCWSHFLTKFIKKALQHRCFTKMWIFCEIYEIFNNTFLQNTSGRVLLKPLKNQKTRSFFFTFLLSSCLRQSTSYSRKKEKNEHDTF